MPGTLKEVRNRINSVKNTQQITKAMKMVSAAKLRRAQDAIQHMRPYVKKQQEVLGNIVANADGDFSMTLAKSRPVSKVLLIVITSDRGLCGGYNSNLIKLARFEIEEKYPEQFRAKNVTIMPLGKRGYEFFLKHHFNVIDTFWSIFSNISFESISKISQFVRDGFSNGDYDKVDIIYSEFLNAAMQRFKVEQFLPVPKAEKAKGHATRADFIFEPNEEQLIEELMPKILNTQLYKAVLDSNASEHGARMTAMDQATENANEILHELRISYNRARQAAITTELTEIVSGAAALQG